MTVDVDSLSSLLKFYSINRKVDISEERVAIEDGVSELLETFDYENVKATFFVPGKVCLEHCNVIRKVYKLGHEIACHGLNHDKNEFNSKSYSTQEKSIAEATEVIRRCIGVAPLGFRAPCLRINSLTLKALEQHSYLYDSSVISTLIPGYYGTLRAPLKPYFPSYNSIVSHGSCKVLEIPVSVEPLSHIPISGAWMKNLGFKWLKFSIKLNLYRGNPIVFYLHPRDVVDLPMIKGLPKYFYTKTGEKTLKILRKIISYSKSLGVKFVKAGDFAQFIKHPYRY
jgi:peptidoglycan/xylan/chitin deacetylase (PgdA/CDA1 family)